MVVTSLIISYLAYLSIGSVAAAPISSLNNGSVFNATRALYARGGPDCPQLNAVNLNTWVSNGYYNQQMMASHGTNFLGHGAFGCVWDLPGGWNVQTTTGFEMRPAVIKSARIPGKQLDPKETEALTKLGELYLVDFVDGRWWYVIRKHLGKRLDQTETWKNFFQGENYLRPSPAVSAERIWECQQLLDRVYHSATNAILGYMEKGLHHQDYHYGNLVFSDDLSRADLVDWGIWTPFPGPTKQSDVDVVYNYVSHRDVPKEDSAVSFDSGMRYYQGVCTSVQRSNGLPAKPYWH